MLVMSPDNAPYGWLDREIEGATFALSFIDQDRAPWDFGAGSGTLAATVVHTRRFSVGNYRCFTPLDEGTTRYRQDWILGEAFRRGERIHTEIRIDDRDREVSCASIRCLRVDHAEDLELIFDLPDFEPL